MAILTKVLTEFGEEKELYLRINSAELSNHGVESTALVRGYLSEQAFKDDLRCMYEDIVTCNVDVSRNVWEQFYSELKNKYSSAVDC